MASGGDPGGSSAKGLNIEKTYQKKSQLEHILLRPDSYIGLYIPIFLLIPLNYLTYFRFYFCHSLITKIGLF